MHQTTDKRGRPCVPRRAATGTFATAGSPACPRGHFLPQTLVATAPRAPSPQQLPEPGKPSLPCVPDGPDCARPGRERLPMDPMVSGRDGCRAGRREIGSAGADGVRRGGLVGPGGAQQRVEPRDNGRAADPGLLIEGLLSGSGGLLGLARGVRPLSGRLASVPFRQPASHTPRTVSRTSRASTVDLLNAAGAEADPQPGGRRRRGRGRPPWAQPPCIRRSGGLPPAANRCVGWFR